jgi:hypothetical protein
VATLVTLGAKSAAAEVSHPGIVRISLETQLTERAVYPPGICQGNFDGAYTMATMYKSGVFAGNKVAFWGSAAGALKAGNYPIDEFVYLLGGRSCYGGCRRYPTRISRRSFGHSKGLGRNRRYLSRGFLPWVSDAGRRTSDVPQAAGIRNHRSGSSAATLHDYGLGGGGRAPI